MEEIKIEEINLEALTNAYKDSVNLGYVLHKLTPVHRYEATGHIIRMLIDPFDDFFSMHMEHKIDDDHYKEISMILPKLFDLLEQFNSEDAQAMMVYTIVRLLVKPNAYGGPEESIPTIHLIKILEEESLSGENNTESLENKIRSLLPNSTTIEFPVKHLVHIGFNQFHDIKTLEDQLDVLQELELDRLQELGLLFIQAVYSGYTLKEIVFERSGQ